MNNSRVCPKCGDENMKSKRLRIYRRSGKRVWGTRPVLLGLAGASLLFFILIIFAVLFNPDNEWFMIPLGFLYFGSFPTYLFIDYKLSDKAQQDQNQCLKCGHKWSERINDSDDFRMGIYDLPGVILWVNCPLGRYPNVDEILFGEEENSALLSRLRT